MLQVDWFAVANDDFLVPGLRGDACLSAAQTQPASFHLQPDDVDEALHHVEGRAISGTVYTKFPHSMKIMKRGVL